MTDEDREVAEMFRRGTGGKYDRDVEHLAAALARYASPLRTRIAELEGALRTADEALCAYACHAGPEAPCIRSKDQCASECGKEAGDALLALRATLNGEKKHG